MPAGQLLIPHADISLGQFEQLYHVVEGPSAVGQLISRVRVPRVSHVSYSIVLAIHVFSHDTVGDEDEGYVQVLLSFPTIYDSDGEAVGQEVLDGPPGACHAAGVFLFGGETRGIFVFNQQLPVKPSLKFLL